ALARGTGGRRSGIDHRCLHRVLGLVVAAFVILVPTSAPDAAASLAVGHSTHGAGGGGLAILAGATVLGSTVQGLTMHRRAAAGIPPTRAHRAVRALARAEPLLMSAALILMWLHHGL
ncbi:hypothetical protein, partial [Microbacterium sp.]|uniref:hypothetical protein n=1 Tax=Microbacterium sp. TaxID=51671 RepID=UPI003C795AC4